MRAPSPTDASAPDGGRARLGSPRFLSFLFVQFVGAANDNAFKQTLTLLILALPLTEREQAAYSSLATALLPLPFLLFSPLAGYLADRFPKQRMILITTAPEVLAMALGAVGFAIQSVPFLLGVLFVGAAQSAFFSPVKYGLLPESMEHRDLSMANGVLQMATNVAILAGAILGLVAFQQFRDRLELAGLLYVSTALLGTLFAAYVPRTPPGNPRARLRLNPLATLREDWAEVRRTSHLDQALLGLAYYWLLGSLFFAVVPLFARNVLGTSVGGAGVMLMILAVGISAGSVLAGRLSHGRVELGLVPLGSLGLGLCCLDLGLYGGLGPRLAGGLPARAVLDLLGLGVAGGLFVVPLSAQVQQRSPEGGKGRILACSNLLSFSGVLAAAGAMHLLFQVLGVGSRQVVLACGLLTLGVTAYIVALAPQFLVRLVLWLLTNTLYRLQIVGDRHLPAGGGLLVANHVSWVDWLLLGSACDRMVRFLMFRPLHETPGLRWFFRRMHAIPIAAGDPPPLSEESLAKARREIEAGHLVCIFAEGSITRTGHLLPFKRGLERIAAGTAAPIIPVCLDGVWGSLFSYERGRVLFKRPRHPRAPVRVLFGAPLPPTATAFEVRERIQELAVEGFRLRRELQRPLAVELLRRCRRWRRRPFLVGADGRRLTYGQALAHALWLRRRLFASSAPGARVACVLPPGIDATLANLAALLAGRVVVNLPPDLAPEPLREMLERLHPAHVITTVELERARATGREPGPADRLLAGRWVPAPVQRALFLGRGRRPPRLDDAAAVVFGSRPVSLSHHNLLSNIESLAQVFRLERGDRILGLLSCSSSFGLTGNLLAPLMAGTAIVWPADPADVPAAAALAVREGVTVLPVAAERLGAFAALPAGALAGLRDVVTAGPALAGETLARFAERHGVTPRTGLGCEEAAPLIALDVPAARPRGAGGARRVGHPLPGVAVRIVDPESGRALGAEHPGRLWVRGPNVMLGYVDDPAATARVVRDGWLDTGHVARVEADGHLTVLESTP